MFKDFSGRFFSRFFIQALCQWWFEAKHFFHHQVVAEVQSINHTNKDSHLFPIKENRRKKDLCVEKYLQKVTLD